MEKMEVESISRPEFWDLKRGSKRNNPHLVWKLQKRDEEENEIIGIWISGPQKSQRRRQPSMQNCVNHKKGEEEENGKIRTWIWGLEIKIWNWDLNFETWKEASKQKREEEEKENSRWDLILELDPKFEDLELGRDFPKLEMELDVLRIFNLVFWNWDLNLGTWVDAMLSSLFQQRDRHGTTGSEIGTWNWDLKSEPETWDLNCDNLNCENLDCAIWLLRPEFGYLGWTCSNLIWNCHLNFGIWTLDLVDALIWNCHLNLRTWVDCTERHELRLRLEFGDLSGFVAGTQSEIWDLKLRPKFGWGVSWWDAFCT